jgi:flagellar biogenesis protein FliO
VSGPSFEEGARLLGTLLVIVGGLFVVGRFLKTRRATHGPIRVHARVPVAKGAALMIVTVGSRRLLLAAGERGVSLVTELEAEDADLEPAPEPESARSPALVPGIASLPSSGPGTGLVHRLRLATVRRVAPRPSRAHAR